MSILSVQNLRVQYDQQVVIKDLSLNLGSGIHWLFGHNGSGKSTLLRACAGIVRPAAGSIKVNGHALDDEPMAAKRCLYWVPDKPMVYPFLTGKQYLMMLADIKKTSATVEPLLSAFKLDDFENTSFADMSFGTRRKFTLLGCLIGGPDLLLLDEPFNGLDAASLQVFTDWLQVQDKAMLVASHDEVMGSFNCVSRIDLHTE